MTKPNEREPQQEELLKRKYMEFQLLGQQIGRFREQMQQLDQQLVELDNVKDTLDELKEVKQSTELFVPVSSGIFMRASAGATDKVVLNVGASVAVEKTIPDAQQLISEQMQQAEALRKQMMENLNRMLEAAKRLQGELEELVK